MSLEDALNANTAALKAHTALLEKGIAAASGAKAGAAPAAAGKPAAAAGKPAAAKPAAPKAPTLEKVTEAVTAFLKTGDKETRDTRKGQVGLIIEHFSAARFTEIDPANWAEALGYLKDFEEGRTPAFIDEGGGGEGDDGGEEEDASLV